MSGAGHLRPVSEVPVPPGFSGLPVRSELFVGREKELAQLRTVLSGAAIARRASADEGLSPGAHDADASRVVVLRYSTAG